MAQVVISQAQREDDLIIVRGTLNGEQVGVAIPRSDFTAATTKDAKVALIAERMAAALDPGLNVNLPGTYTV